jgi:RNA polymerase sigma-70 factor, ECF subfamily
MAEMTGRDQEMWLVLRAQAGDREALDDLLKAIGEPVYRYVLRLVGQREMAEDILQEVFIRIYRKLGWLKEPALLRPWVYRIASREAFRFLKRERRWSEQIRDEAILEAVQAESSAEDAGAELLEQLPQLISRVSPASRAVLILHYLHDMPLTEVADVLGLSPGTVKSRLAYGLACLRRALGEQKEKAR